MSETLDSYIRERLTEQGLTLSELSRRAKISRQTLYDLALVPGCSVPRDHVPVRSWPLFRAREVMREVIASMKKEQRS